jgi:hypothetical protein
MDHTDPTPGTDCPISHCRHSFTSHPCIRMTLVPRKYGLQQVAIAFVWSAHYAHTQQKPQFLPLKPKQQASVNKSDILSMCVTSTAGMGHLKLAAAVASSHPSSTVIPAALAGCCARLHHVTRKTRIVRVSIAMPWSTHAWQKAPASTVGFAVTYPALALTTEVPACAAVVGCGIDLIGTSSSMSCTCYAMSTPYMQ